jgi:hypothetical protein
MKIEYLGVSFRSVIFIVVFILQDLAKACLNFSIFNHLKIGG